MSAPPAVRQAIGNLHDATDVGKLFDRLGYEPVEQRLPRGRCVARHREFWVISACGPDSPRLARQLAGDLKASARPGLSVAIGATEITLSTWVGDGRVRSLSLDRAEQAHDLLDVVQRLSPRPTDSTLQHALRVAELLGTRPLGERFYRGFQSVWNRFVAEVPGIRDEHERRLLALLPLIRVLFLYFVQAKGWLDGDSTYLRARVDDALHTGGGVHRRFLHPLFFETLNLPVRSRTGAPRLGRVPYLNGGLFRPHAFEQRWEVPLFSDDAWQAAFDDLFEQFRFYSGDGNEGNVVHPDLLGLVFERLMEPGRRRRSGSYYTPRIVVDDLVTRGLATHVAEALGLNPEAALDMVSTRSVPKRHREDLRRALADLRIIDPAAGTGAFLLGCLEHLTALNLTTGGHATGAAPAVRRQVLERNLYGVDVNPMAVHLAELRLWLALIAGDPTREVDRVQPLPNLDGTVRHGDSLLDPLHTEATQGTPDVAAQRRRIGRCRKAIFALRGERHRRALQQLRSQETRLLRQLLELQLVHIRRRLDEHDRLRAQPSLLGGTTPVPRPQLADQLRWLRREHEVKETLRQLEAGELSGFSPAIHFPDVVLEGGFSMVVGNPPWVRAESLSREQRDTLADRFPSWAASGRRGFRHQPDLSVAFLDRALSLVRPGGVIALLVPDKLLTTGYAEPLRQRLRQREEVRVLRRWNHHVARRFQATVYPLSMVVRRHPPSGSHQVAMIREPEQHSMPQQQLPETGPWPLIGRSARRAIAHLDSTGIPLRELGPINLGVKTGADRILVGQLEGVEDEWSTVHLADATVRIPSEFLRPAVRGRDVRPFLCAPDRVIVWLHGRRDDSLPEGLGDYLTRHRERLERRADYRGGCLGQVFRVSPTLRRHRVVWADIAPRMRAAALRWPNDGDLVPLNSCYVFGGATSTAAHVVTLCLNSTWARAAVTVRGDPARGGYRRHNERVVGSIPIPRADRWPSLQVLSVRAHQQDVPQDEIDQAVGDALGLDAAVRQSLRAAADDLGD